MKMMRTMASEANAAAPKFGGVPQTFNEWVKRDEIDTGARAGVTRPTCNA